MEAHITRLKFYHDKSLNMTEDLAALASNSGIEYVVDQLRDIRLRPDGGWEIKVSWAGFLKSDETWEPADVLLQDVRKLVKQFIESCSPSPALEAMARDLGVPFPKEGGVGDVGA